MNPTEKRLKHISKYLSLHLRHQPEQLGLTLAPGGWVDVKALLSASAAKGFDVTLEELRQVVATNNKQRFAFDETGTRIRANQGHSVAVDLQLEPVEPPTVLYHGTAEKTLPAILQDGLLPMQRHHVHLSADVSTAQRVGARHGKPLVLTVSALEMHHQGHRFYCSSNGVWLCDRIPPTYLQPCHRLSRSGPFSAPSLVSLRHKGLIFHWWPLVLNCLLPFGQHDGFWCQIFISNLTQ